jgi:hypothetical protein
MIDIYRRTDSTLIGQMTIDLISKKNREICLRAQTGIALTIVGFAAVGLFQNCSQDLQSADPQILSRNHDGDAPTTFEALSSGPNLLANPNFLSGTLSWAISDKRWGIYVHRNSVTNVVEYVQVWEGTISQIVPAVSSHTYELQVDSMGYGDIFLTPMSSDKRPLAGQTLQVIGKRTRTTTKIQLKTPPGTAFIRVMFWHEDRFQTAPKLALYSASLTDLGISATPNVTVTAATPNLIINGGFESASLAPWINDRTYDARGGLLIKSPRAGVQAARFYAEASDPKIGSGTRLSQSFVVKPGATYELHYYAKGVGTPTVNGVPAFALINGPPEWYSPTEVSAAYQEYIMIYRVPVNQTKMNISLTGMAYQTIIDDVAVYELMPATIHTLMDTTLILAEKKIAATLAHIARTTTVPAMPRSTVSGTWKLVPPMESTEWTSGFFPGCLWQIYEARGTNLAQARTFTGYLANMRAPKQNPPPKNYLHGNLGLDMTNSYMNKLELDLAATDVATSKAILARAAGDLKGIFHPYVKAVYDGGSWQVSGTDVYVPIDYIMNIEPFFWYAKNGGGAIYYDMAILHAKTIMNNHIRADGGSYHHVLFNSSGAVIRKQTHQGYSDSSTWARGQAWGIYGFTMVYRETRDPQFLATAEKMANYFIDHLPADKIPKWDFNAPDPTEKDSSAAAIAASGLIELSQYSTDPVLRSKFLNAATTMLVVLMRSYVSSDPAQMGILLHGVGHHPNGTEINVSLIYGDYYFLEALNRYKALLH